MVLVKACHASRVNVSTGPWRSVVSRTRTAPAEATEAGGDQALVTTGGLAQARHRLGHEPVKGTFELVAAPAATLDTPGAFLGNWRKMSIDGLEWDLSHIS
jgi:hypothetical protein